MIKMTTHPLAEIKQKFYYRMLVGRIIPYNHPLMFAAGKIAAPLAAGNTVVLKPADQTPISPLIFGELFRYTFWRL
ncbi:hypothetical protein BSNK01_30170 [Bacillaceae bacterium]